MILSKLKQDTEPNENIVFWDSKTEQGVQEYYMPEDTYGFIVDQGKTDGQRHLSFFFLDDYMQEKSIEFFGLDTFDKYVETIVVN